MGRQTSTYTGKVTRSMILSFSTPLNQQLKAKQTRLLLQIKDFEKAQIMLDRRKTDYDKAYNTLEDSILSVHFEIEDVERKQSQSLGRGTRNLYSRELERFLS